MSRTLLPLVCLAFASVALAADGARARFRWADGASWRVEVVLERIVRQNGAVLEAYKTLGAYDLAASSDDGGLRIASSHARIVADDVRDANPLEGYALGAWAAYHVDKHGGFVGLASGDAPPGVEVAQVEAGARRQWADLVESWAGRTFVAGSAPLDVPQAEVATEEVTLGVPCDAATCVRVERTVTFSPTAAQREGVAVGGNGALLGWTDVLRATFEPGGVLPHEVASERTVRLAIAGHASPVERVDRSTRRFTPLGG